jgi:methylglutaconyl-CoA hydratase
VDANRVVRLEVAGGVATVTLDAPATRNALSSAMVEQLAAALRLVRADESVRVVVLTGGGPVFCAGADLKESRERANGSAGQALPQPVTGVPEVISLLWDSPVPVVCRVNGPARAGGIGLLAACDLAIAPATATFAFTEVRIGVVPAVIAVPCLRRMPEHAALELFLTGATFDAARAREVGLLTAAPPAAEFDATVERYVGMLLRGAPEALTLTKRVTRLVPTLPPGEAFRQMTELSAQRFVSAEGREGIAAFAEKRDPSWIPSAPVAGGGASGAGGGGR